ncbi:MAG: FAD binding domain-containing protein [Sphingomonadaceae bacterium]|uniref:FAD binding domain-containing protein n=1 Tax=Thermaurantiacus sp. TaxID=2820283 RepID=UPI00298ED0F6|nr:FAD binding domain-containing protein [Thermaurantiacus sp.]MCS6986327.1 FAD binding domain-containing protein [Sphingomonadaceae bacterium]MDW8414411.1 FAD binding domain-containing protein [Thermaurantiacus sp.]
MPAFQYLRPASLTEAIGAFRGDAAYLAGGHTLIPAMKTGLRAVERLIDLSAIPDLSGIERRGDRMVVGAMVRHAAVAHSPLVQATIPGLARLAAGIGDPQVRRRGTLGGSLANNDPAADYPAAALALDATIETDRGTHLADDFFQGMFATALAEGELIRAVAFRIPQAFAYAKFRHPASRYALAGVAVARFGEGPRVAVTGVAAGVFRWTEAERAIAAGALASLGPLERDDLIGDLHASAEYRAHLARVMLERALEELVR